MIENYASQFPLHNQDPAKLIQHLHSNLFNLIVQLGKSFGHPAERYHSANDSEGCLMILNGNERNFIAIEQSCNKVVFYIAGWC